VQLVLSIFRYSEIASEQLYRSKARIAFLHTHAGCKSQASFKTSSERKTSLNDYSLYRCVTPETERTRDFLCGQFLSSEARTSLPFILRTKTGSWGPRGTALRTALLALAIFVPAASQSQVPEGAPSSKMANAGSSAGGGSAAMSGVNAGLTDEPIFAGEIVHVSVFNAPDFSTIMRVSQTGDIGVPYLGVVHVAGLSSAKAGDLITGELKNRNLVLDPHLLVTVESTNTGITVLGEVKSPGVYPPSGKHMLSDLLAQAGGVTTNTGRVVEISNVDSPDEKTYVPWDPTMHNTSAYDRPIQPGQRVLVKSCGFVYVGGSVGKPGAYAPCSSPIVRLSQIISLAGGLGASPNANHTIISRPNPDGSRTIYQINLDKVLRGDAQDPVVHDEDIVFVPPSYWKATLKRLPDYAFGLGSTLLYVYR
jgi:polysaccharide biosynthesis/export protein